MENIQWCSPRDRFIIYPFHQRYGTMKEISRVNDTATLQQDLNNVFHWSLQNNVLLHGDKFDLITLILLQHCMTFH